MRAFLLKNRWATAWVACLLLFATSGTSLSRMTCLQGGHSVLSLGRADACCPEESGGDLPSLKADCCSLTSATLEGIHVVASSSVVLNALFLALDAAPIHLVKEYVQGPVRWLDGRPPPMDGSDRLVSLRVHRI